MADEGKALIESRVAPAVTGTRQLELLRDISAALNEANDMTTAMDAILPRLGEALGLSTAWAFRYDEKRKSFVEVGASGLPPALASDDAASLKCGWCECQDQFVEGKLHSAINIVRCSRLQKAVGDRRDLAYHASIPLRSKDKALGILNVAAAGNTVFTHEALALLTTVGNQVAIAADRAALLSEERRRTQQFAMLSDLAGELFNLGKPGQIPQFAAEQLVERLGYEAAGIILISADAATSFLDVPLVAAAHATAMAAGMEYAYTADHPEPLLPESERILLPDARSVLTHPIAHADYALRLESRAPHAFHDTDRDVLSAFAWLLSAALDNIRSQQQSVSEAKWVERRQLAAGLHDAVSQRLFSALLIARTASLQLEKSEADEPSPQLATLLDRIQQLISESQEEMRTIIRTLRATDTRGLTALIRDRLEPLHLQSQTRIHLHATPDADIPVTRTAQQALLSFLDEGLHNALRHSHATELHVTVSRDEAWLVLCIADNGCGFEPPLTQSAHDGLGLQSMNERIERFGGRLEVDSVLQKGTTLTARVPIYTVAATPSDEGDDRA